MTNFLSDMGPLLIENGYRIVPIKQGFKYPRGLKNWQKLKLTEADLSNYRAFKGVGIMTEHTPAIDIDILDSDVAETIVDYIEENFFYKSPQRIGAAPKSLFLFRTDKPFKKMLSTIYEDPNGQKHGIEVLGDGQQFVSFGIHPDTKKEYYWMDASPLTVLVEKLPVLHVEEVESLFRYFDFVVPTDWKVHSQKAKTFETRSSDPLENALPKIRVTESLMGEALESIDPDDYHVWVRTGMGLHHQTGGSDRGFEVWNTWGSQSSKHDTSESQAKWKTFAMDLTQGPPITAASILKLAGIRNPLETQNGKDPLKDFIDRYTYILEGDRVCDINKPPYLCISKLAEFKNLTANIRHEVPWPSAQDKDRTKYQAVHLSWLVHPKRRHAESTQFHPGKDRIVEDLHKLRWINTFYTPEFKQTTKTDKIKVVQNHFDYLFPILKEREWFIKWIAFNLQRPGIRCKVTPLHISIEHGTGRGWIVELMQNLLGPWNCTKTKMATLSGEGSAGGFNDFLHNSLFCAIEEVKEGAKRFTVSDRIRDVLTERYLEVNVKFGKKQTQKIYTNFFFMSNHSDAMVLSKQDRRIVVLSGPEHPRSSQYYDELYEFLEDETSLGQLHSWFSSMDLKGFQWTRALNTVGKDHMIVTNYTPTEKYFQELLTDPPAEFMTKEQIRRGLCGLSGGELDLMGIDEPQLKKLLDHTTTHVPKQIRISKDVVCRPWQMIGRKLRTNQEIRHEIEKAENVLEKSQLGSN